jgi:hypothetical protein
VYGSVGEGASVDAPWLPVLAAGELELPEDVVAGAVLVAGAVVVVGGGVVAVAVLVVSGSMYCWSPAEFPDPDAIAAGAPTDPMIAARARQARISRRGGTSRY